MKRIACFILLSFCFYWGFSQKTKEKILFDSTNLPSWQNFERQPPQNSRHAAETASGIEIKYEIKNNILSVFAAAYFYPNRSWVNPQEKKPALFAHEILHFKITELFARKLRKQLSDLENVPVNNIAKRINTIFSQNRKAENTLQLLYDNKTKHGLNADKQKQWQTKIRKQLKALLPYSKHTIEISL